MFTRATVKANAVAARSGVLDHVERIQPALVIVSGHAAAKRVATRRGLAVMTSRLLLAHHSEHTEKIKNKYSPQAYLDSRSLYFPLVSNN